MLHLKERINALREITGGSDSCGWMRDEPAFLLYSFIKFYKPDLIIQTGHLWGKSAIIALEALNDEFLYAKFIEDKEQNADKKVTAFINSRCPKNSDTPRLISIDPLPKGVPNHEEGIAYLKSLYKNFHFYKGTSDIFFEEEGEKIKHNFSGKRVFGIVDGAHHWFGMLRDLENCAHIGCEVIFLDDTIWYPHIGKGAAVFAKRYGYQYVNLMHYGGVGILTKENKKQYRYNTTIHISLTGLLLYRFFGIKIYSDFFRTILGNMRRYVSMSRFGAFYRRFKNRKI